MNPLPRAFIAFAGLATVLLPVVATGQDHSTSAPSHTNHFARPPYVQLATPHSMTVVWRTDGPMMPLVRYGREVANLDQVSSTNNTITRVGLTTNKTELLKLGQSQPELLRLPRLHSAPVGCYQYEVRLTNLAPDTLYYYSVSDGERRLTEADASYHFVTLPMPGTPRGARFWVVGDSGTGREAQHTVHSAMIDFVKKDQRPLDFYIHVGDMAYNRGKDVEFQTRFFEPYEATLRHTVCWASMGNHEGLTSRGTNGIGPYYDAYVLPTRAEAGGLASGTEAYYSFDFGKAHFICLDSHDLDRKPTGMMARWLKMDMERTKADWVIAYFHHPPYTKGSHDSDREKQLIEMRTHIMPILESGGVDLVLSGHSHIYERSMLIDGAYATPTVAEGVVLDDREGNPKTDGPYRKSAGLTPNNGEIQIVAGHGGTTLRRKGTMPIMRKIIVEHGSVIVDVDGDTMRGIMLNKFGEIRDEFAILKRGEVRHERLFSPWQPPIWKAPKSPGQDTAAEPPEDFVTVIPKYSEWTYLAGSDPEDGKWTEMSFAAKDWKKGEAPFGYDYKAVRTSLDDMKGQYQRIYLRHTFEVEQAAHIADIGLMINYDDAFVAYLNGKEVVRKNVGKGSGSKAEQLKSHDAAKYSYFQLKDFEKHLKDGENILAIEGHNVSLDSGDFFIDPFLIIED